MFSTDIDLDFLDRSQACDTILHIPASMWQRGELQKHPSGIYLQDIPLHPYLGCSAISHEQADELGYFKIDFLSNSIYEGVRDKEHLRELMSRDVPWEMFLDRGIVSRLAHIRDHFGIVASIKPQSIIDLAVVLALMRPGKRSLFGKSRAEIDAEIWKNDTLYYFKKSHAVCYAVSITIQLHLLLDQISRELDEQPEHFFPV